MKILEIKNLNIYDNKNNIILDDINVEFEEGKFYAIVGKSGSGKTQFINKIIKISELRHKGEILFKGNKNYILGRNISMIFQEFDLCLNPNMNILEQIIEGAVYHNIYNKNEAIEKTYEILLKFNLDKTILEKYPYELSGGQKQRVIIASIILMNSDIIICDEITSGLDVDNKENIVKILKSLNKTIIFITHNIEIAKKYADEILIVDNKKINNIKDVKEGEFFNIIKKYLGEI